MNAQMSCVHFRSFPLSLALSQWQILESVSCLPTTVIQWLSNVFTHKKNIWWTCEFNQNSVHSGLHLQIWLLPALFFWKRKDCILFVLYSRRMTFTHTLRTSPKDIFSYCSAGRALLDTNKSFVCSSQVEEDKGAIYILVLNLLSCLFGRFVIYTPLRDLCRSLWNFALRGYGCMLVFSWGENSNVIVLLQSLPFYLKRVL